MKDTLFIIGIAVVAGLFVSIMYVLLALGPLFDEIRAKTVFLAKYYTSATKSAISNLTQNITSSVYGRSTTGTRTDTHDTVVETHSVSSGINVVVCDGNGIANSSVDKNAANKLTGGLSENEDARRMLDDNNDVEIEIAKGQDFKEGPSVDTVQQTLNKKNGEMNHQSAPQNQKFGKDDAIEDTEKGLTSDLETAEKEIGIVSKVARFGQFGNSGFSGGEQEGYSGAPPNGLPIRRERKKKNKNIARRKQELTATANPFFVNEPTEDPDQQDDLNENEQAI